jgi:hypothetical protein
VDNGQKEVIGLNDLPPPPPEVNIVLWTTHKEEENGCKFKKRTRCKS